MLIAASSPILRAFSVAVLISIKVDLGRERSMPEEIRGRAEPSK
jgi:hypothetical protein